MPRVPEPPQLTPPPLPSQPPAVPGPTGPGVPLADNPKPVIPRELRQQSLKLKIKVKFVINEDGSCTATLIESTGNTELDASTLETLSRWRWKPATEDGVPVTSSQKFDVDFEVK
jgi:periplasmic protein TonB